MIERVLCEAALPRGSLALGVRYLLNSADERQHECGYKDYEEPAAHGDASDDREED
jgi:hypothetical protein